jgi:hypothetical protein
VYENTKNKVTMRENILEGMALVFCIKMLGPSMNKKGAFVLVNLKTNA